VIKNFGHVCLITKDLKKSLGFYRDILGLKVSRILTVKGKYPETILNIKGIKITYAKLRVPNQPKNRPAYFELHHWKSPRISAKKGYGHVSLIVGNIDREYERLKKLGVKLISRPMVAPHGYTKICFGYDPDRNLIEFVEELKTFKRRRGHDKE
jgi:glyoxylase I family protein